MRGPSFRYARLYRQRIDSETTRHGDSRCPPGIHRPHRFHRFRFPSGPRHGGQILVDALIAHGTDLAFGVPGESYLAVLEGFYQRRDRARFIVCRQEGGAATMADAHGS